MVDNISYSTTLTRNAYAVISDIFAQAVVNIAFSFTDLKELLFIGGFLITVFFKIIIQGISIQKLRHPGNEILITLDTVFSKLLLFFYFITLRFFAAIVYDQVVLFDITWHSVLAITFFVLAWLFMGLKD
jgi:hypothetical protein